MKNKTIGEKYYIHSTIITVLLFLFYLLGVNTSFLNTSVLNTKLLQSDDFDGTVYPIDFFPDPLNLSYKQRNQDFYTINSKYFLRVPSYDPEIFGKQTQDLDTTGEDYKQAIYQKIVYTVPYMSTYNFDYKEYSGSHPGVDIIVPKYTPVKNIANGIVYNVGYQPSGFGNYIVIKHDNVPLASGEKGSLYSLYAHLNDVYVSAGEKLKKGDFIGTVGRSGTATATHLHFQIELSKAPFHPYWHFTANDAKLAGVNFFDAINVGLGKENALANTINPLKFVNANIGVYKEPSLAGNMEFVESKKQKAEEQILSQTGTKTSTGVNILSLTITQIKEEEKIQTGTQIPEIKIAKEETVETGSISKKEEPIATPETPPEIKEVTKVNDVQKAETYIIKDSQVQLLSKNDDALNDLFKSLDDKEIQYIQQEVSTPTDTQVLEGTGIILPQSIFKDVDVNSEIYEKVKYFYDKKIISGFSDNTFKPNANLTRIESLKIILLALEKYKYKNENSKFDDIDNNSWQNNYINSGINNGVISLDNKYFYPGKNISKIEAIKMILNLSGIKLDEKQENLGASDIKFEDWYYKYAKYCIKSGLIKLENGKFNPNKEFTRGELVEFLYEFIKK